MAQVRFEGASATRSLIPAVTLDSIPSFPPLKDKSSQNANARSDGVLAEAVEYANALACADDALLSSISLLSPLLSLSPLSAFFALTRWYDLPTQDDHAR